MARAHALKRAFALSFALVVVPTFAQANDIGPEAVDQRPVRNFILLIGSNAPRPDHSEEDRLKHSDDDVLYLRELFDAADWRTSLVAKFDEQTRARYQKTYAPLLNDENRRPTLSNVRKAMDQILEAVAKAKGEENAWVRLGIGISSHGVLDGAAAAAVLEAEDGANGPMRGHARDRLLTVSHLREFLRRSQADENLLILDFCLASQMISAPAKGPAGERNRRAAEAVARRASAADRSTSDAVLDLSKEPNTGVITAATESGATLQFAKAIPRSALSHVIISALYGAADTDADGEPDGKITFRELEAFLASGLSKLKGDQKMDPYVVAPKVGSSRPIVDWSELKHKRRIVLNGSVAGRLWVQEDVDETGERVDFETKHGARLIEFNKDTQTTVRLVLPFRESYGLSRAGRASLKFEVGEDIERDLSPEVMAAGPATSSKGGLSEEGLDRALFGSRYGPDFIDGYDMAPLSKPPPARKQAANAFLVSGVSGVGMGVLLGGAAIASSLLGSQAYDAYRAANAEQARTHWKAETAAWDRRQTGFAAAAGTVAAAGFALLIYHLITRDRHD